MKFSRVLLVLCLSLFGVDSLAQVCPCGYVQDITINPNCTILESGISEKDVVKDFCAENGTNLEDPEDICRVRGDGAITCRCKCGWSEDTCAEREIGKTVSGILFTLFAFLCFGLGFSMLYWYDKKYGLSDFQVKGELCSTSLIPWVSPKMILAYRFAVFVIGFYYIIDILVSFIGGYVAFTIWNWTLLTIYFGIGTYLSILTVLEKPRTTDGMTVMEKTYFILMNINLPASLLICAVVWAVLYPGARAAGSVDGVVNPFSILSHAINVIFFFIDFMMNGLYIKKYHVSFSLIWGGLYIGFHSLNQLARLAKDEDNCPVYGFLSIASDPGLVIVFCLGLGFVYCLFFLGCLAISKGKEKLLGASKDSETKVTL